MASFVLIKSSILSYFFFSCFFPGFLVSCYKSTKRLWISCLQDSLGQEIETGSWIGSRESISSDSFISSV